MPRTRWSKPCVKHYHRRRIRTSSLQTQLQKNLHYTIKTRVKTCYFSLPLYIDDQTTYFKQTAQARRAVKRPVRFWMHGANCINKHKKNKKKTSKNKLHKRTQLRKLLLVCQKCLHACLLVRRHVWNIHIIMAQKIYTRTVYFACTVIIRQLCTFGERKFSNKIFIQNAQTRAIINGIDYSKRST